VLHSGDTTIVFPNRHQPDARATGVVHVTVPPGLDGTELFEFIAATDGTAWLFTKKSDASAEYVDLGGTTRSIVSDIETTFRHAPRGSVAASYKAVKVGG
jgi:hypothetical protein